MENRYKEVYFDKYCKKCENRDLSDYEEPCGECLEHPVNLYSHKPVNFEEKKRK